MVAEEATAMDSAIFVDTHCHLDFAAFDPDRGSVIRAAAERGVRHIIVPATTAASWSRIENLASAYDAISYGFGLHPYFLDTDSPSQIPALRERLLSGGNKLVAVGETGLDRGIDVDFEVQKECFQQQLKLAAEFDLPVIVHAHKAHDQIHRALKENPVRRGVIHAFAGSIQEADKYIERGFYLGVGGVITYPRAKKTRDAISRVPLDSLLLETDAPDMPLQGRQGERNAPTRIPEVFQVLCELRRESATQIARQLLQNSRDLFGISVP